MIGLFHIKWLRQGKEVLPIVIILFQGINDGLKVFGVAKKISIACIHHNGFDIVLPDIVGVGLLDIEQVIIRDLLLIRAVSFSDIFLQFVDRCVQIDQQFRHDHLLLEDIKQTLVQPEFIFRQVYLGKQKAFGKEIIRYRDLLEKVFLLEKIFQLLEPFRHKKQFHGKGILWRVIVKLWEEGVVRKFL